jgi:hypothetical protein
LASPCGLIQLLFIYKHPLSNTHYFNSDDGGSMSSESLAHSQNTWHNNSEAYHLCKHCHENIKYYFAKFFKRKVLAFSLSISSELVSKTDFEVPGYEA